METLLLRNPRSQLSARWVRRCQLQDESVLRLSQLRCRPGLVLRS